MEAKAEARICKRGRQLIMPRVLGHVNTEKHKRSPLCDGSPSLPRAERLAVHGFGARGRPLRGGVIVNYPLPRNYTYHERPAAPPLFYNGPPLLSTVLESAAGPSEG